MALERAQEFVAGTENRLGIVQRDAAGLGELQALARTHEQRVADLLLQLA